LLKSDKCNGQQTRRSVHLCSRL